jgi:hypothetical protein
MATDGIVLMFWIPMLLIALALLVAYFVIDKNSAAPKEFSKLSVRRVILGLSGSMFGTIIYSCGTAILIGFGKVEKGHIDYVELISLVVGYCLYMFALVGPVIMLGVLFIGIPLMLGLARIRLASHLGSIIVAAIIGSLYASYVFVSPYNDWCTSNSTKCVASNFRSVFIACALVGIGFSFGARLPFLRSGGENAT